MGEGVGWIEDDEAPQQLPQSGGGVTALSKLSVLTISHELFHLLTSNDEFRITDFTLRSASFIPFCSQLHGPLLVSLLPCILF